MSQRSLAARVSTFALSLVTAAAVAPGAAAAATNLVPNGHFDGGALGWNKDMDLQATVGKSLVDAGGKEGGGSLRLHTLGSGPWEGYLQSACFAVEPGQDVVFGLASLAPGALGAWFDVGARLVFFGDGACAMPTGDTMVTETLDQFSPVTWRPAQGYGRVPGMAGSARLRIQVKVTEAPSEILVDEAFVHLGATCAATGQFACLGNGRFRVNARWQVAAGDFGFAQLGTFDTGVDDSTFATFFDPANVELVVKVLDGCSYNERFWVFAAGLTNVGVRLKVRDTHSGQSWVHDTMVGDPFEPVLDTGAFDTCPH
jgi:hypothetical protein